MSQQKTNRELIDEIKRNIVDMKYDTFQIKNDLACIKNLIQAKREQEEVVVKVKKEQQTQTETEIATQKGWFW